MPTSLRLIAKSQSAAAPPSLVFPGMPLRVSRGHEFLNSLHGISKPYRLGELCETTGSKPDKLHWDVTQSPEVIIWDRNISHQQLPSQVMLQTGSVQRQLAELNIGDNSLCVLNSRLEGPELIDSHGITHLKLQPVFDLNYTARNFPAQIAELRVVESQRFLSLENQTAVVLTQTDDALGPALALTTQNTSPEEDEFFTQIFPVVLLHENIGLCANQSIHQRIFNEYEGVSIANITVLEKYTSYFLQRFVNPTPSGTLPLGCWVPAAPPVDWGWSIRVGKDTYGDWTIVRRKLMLPTLGHEGLQLPRWNCRVNCTADGYWQ